MPQKAKLVYADSTIIWFGMGGWLKCSTFFLDLAQAFDRVQKFMSSHLYVVASLPNWSPYVDAQLSKCPLCCLF